MSKGLFVVGLYLYLFVAPFAYCTVEDKITGKRSVLSARSYECGFCELVMYTIYTYLTQNSTESEIANVVQQICAYVPTNEESFCKSIISTYGPEIVELIVQKETPDQICLQLGFCNATASHVSQLWSSFKGDFKISNFECNVCSWMKFVLTQLLEGDSEVDVLEFLESDACVAPLIPKEECLSRVKEFKSSFLGGVKVGREMDCNTICKN